jgi:hypothetical protein
VTAVGEALPEFAGWRVLLCDRDLPAAISASTATRTSVADTRLRLKFIGASSLVKRLLLRGSSDRKRELFPKPSTEATFSQRQVQRDITVQYGWRLGHSADHIGYAAKSGEHLEVLFVTSGSCTGIDGWDSLVTHCFISGLIELG